MVTALTQVRKCDGKAIERIKELIDKGKDPEDTRMGANLERLSSTSGPTLADLVSAASQHDENEVDIDELNDDLSFLLVDKSLIGSDIFQRTQNLQP